MYSEIAQSGCKLLAFYVWNPGRKEKKRETNKRESDKRKPNSYRKREMGK